MNNEENLFYTAVGVLITILGVYLSMNYSLWFLIVFFIGVIKLTYPMWVNK